MTALQGVDKRLIGRRRQAGFCDGGLSDTGARYGKGWAGKSKSRSFAPLTPWTRGVHGV